METIVLLIGLLLIGVITWFINRGKRMSMPTIDDTQPMAPVESITDYEKVLLNAAKSLWVMSSVIDEHGNCQWYVVDRKTGMRVFDVDEQTHSVRPIQQRKRTRRTAKV